MRRVFFLITVILLLCSCAGTGQQTLDLKGVNFSFTTPPYNWNKMKLPGELVVGTDYVAAWERGGTSWIMVMAKKHTEETRKKPYKNIIYTAINNRKNALSGQCQKVVDSIDKESEGVFQEGVTFARTEATIDCYKENKIYYSEKTINCLLNTEKYLYSFIFSTLPEHFKRDSTVFDQMLNSFSYIE